jgi:hypothetical protein
VCRKERNPISALSTDLEQQVDETPVVNGLIEYDNLTKTLRFLTT